MIIPLAVICVLIEANTLRVYSMHNGIICKIVKWATGHYLF